MKELIQSDRGPRPGGAYSPALRAGDSVFVSGQVPVDPETGEISGATIEEQTERVLANVELLLEAAGAGMADVVRCTVHLSDIGNFKQFNEVYASRFPDPKPTRTTVQSGLAAGMLVEVDAMAYKPRA